MASIITISRFNVVLKQPPQITGSMEKQKMKNKPMACPLAASKFDISNQG